MNHSVWLLVPILLPILAGILVPLMHFKKRIHRELFVGTFVILNTIITYFLLWKGSSDSFTIVRMTNDLSIALKVDGLSKVFAGLVAGLWPFATCFAFEYMKHEKRENYFFTFYTASYGITLGVAFAANAFTLYLFYELLTLITLPLVMHSMDEKSIKAGMTYIKYSIGGAAFAFISLIFIMVYGSTTEFTLGGVLDLSIIGGKTNLLLLAYVFAFFGFGVKAAVFPFHGWLPKASVAPTPVTALLHAVAVVKAGVFAIMRITYYSFGADFLKGTWAQWLVMTFALITILYGSSMAVKEQHIKRRLAYSTISNLSYILFGITLMSPAGLVGGLTHMVFHGLMKIALFFCVGAIMYKTHKEFVYEMEGLGRKMPVTFTVFTLASIALVGVPPFTGFISKWNLAYAAVESGNVIPAIGVMVLLISALLTAIYLLTIVVKAFFPEKGFNMDRIGSVKDPNWYMLAPLCAFVIAIIIFGVHSAPLIEFFTRIASGLI